MPCAIRPKKISLLLNGNKLWEKGFLMNEPAQTCRYIPPSWKKENDQAQTIFERAKQLDPYLELDPKKEVEKLSAKS